MTVVCRPGGAQTGPRSSFPLILTCGAPKHSCFLASRPLLLPPCSRAVGFSLLHAAERRHVQLHLVFPCRPGIFREGTRYSYLEILNLQLRANIYCMCIRYIRFWALGGAETNETWTLLRKSALQPSPPGELFSRMLVWLAPHSVDSPRMLRQHL